MDIIRNEKIVEIKDMLFDKLKQDISFLEKRVTIQERSVLNWKYATDKFYTLIPFEKELNKMKKGRILKNIQFDERFASPYIFSFGFSKEEKLLLTQYSLGKDFGIISQVYDHHNSGCIEYFILRSYPSKKYNSKLVSIGILIQINDLLQAHVCVSDGKHNWSTTAYHVGNENKVDKIFRYASGWNNQTEYDLEYVDNKLNKIKIGNVVWWKSEK